MPPPSNSLLLGKTGRPSRQSSSGSVGCQTPTLTATWVGARGGWRVVHSFLLQMFVCARAMCPTTHCPG